MKTLRKIGCVLLAVLTIAACNNDELEENVPEGLPVSLRLSLAIPEAGAADMTRATDVQETSVEKVALLFYKKNQLQEPPVVVEITDMGNPTKISETNYKYTVEVPATELYSGEWYLYAIANYDKQFVSVTLDELKSMTKAQIDEFCTGGSTELDIVETAILMSGKYEQEDADGTLTLRPSENELQGDPCLVLRRLIAKTIFNFKGGDGVTFTPISYDLYNYSTSSTLMERTGWTGSKATCPGALGYKANSGTLMEKKNIPIDGKSFTFYTQENVQPDASITDYNLREERVGDNDRTFKNAPANATYVVVKGRYEGPGENGQGSVTGDVQYTIHLGDFSESGSNGNFTVRRNVKYTYDVTVKGVNNIIVEAKCENGTYQHGAEGDIIKKDDELTVHLDAHYEQVLFALEINANISDYALQIKTPYNMATYTSTNAFPADATKAGGDYDWVEFGKPATTTTFQSYAKLKSNGKLCNIKELLEKLGDINNSANQEYFLVSGGKVYVAAYVNEYFYEGETDLAKFVNADDRQMMLSSGTNVSSDGHSTYTTTPIFAIRQRSIKSPMSLTLDNPFGLETVEEEGEEGQAGITRNGSDTQTTTTTSDNGWSNFKNAIGHGQSWDTYVNDATNGYIGGKHGQGMQINYDYALYRVLSRNRDNNGNGIIDDDEIRWYLPSQNQCLAIWYGNNSLPTEAKINVSSRTNKTYQTSSNNSNNRTWWADEGVAFGSWKGNNPDENQNAVRAIRSLKDTDGATSRISLCADNVITVFGLSDVCLRTTNMTGNYNTHGTGANEDRLPRAFKIAKEDFGSYTASMAATDMNIGEDYSEEPDKSDRGQWRVPNEKELGLMLEYISGLSTYTVARTTYKDGTRYYYIQEGGFISTHAAVGSATSCPIRLVRDVSPTTNVSKSYDGSYTKSGNGFGVR